MSHQNLCLILSYHPQVQSFLVLLNPSIEPYQLIFPQQIYCLILHVNNFENHLLEALEDQKNVHQSDLDLHHLCLGKMEHLFYDQLFWLLIQFQLLQRFQCVLKVAEIIDQQRGGAVALA